jgi:hypothetical protein
MLMVEEIFANHGFAKVISNVTYYEYSQQLGVEFSDDASALNEQQKSAASLFLFQK